MKRRISAALAVAAALMLSSVQAAHASDAPSSTEPAADIIYGPDTLVVNDPLPPDANLTPEEEAARVVTLERVRTSGTIPGGPVLNSTDPTGGRGVRKCTWYKSTINGKNIGGAYVWRFSLRVDWCYLNNKVVSISPPQVEGYVYGWAGVAGWTYEGVRNTSQWDYYGDKWVYRTYAQGAFKFCSVIRVLCVQSRYPSHTIDAYGNGRSGVYWTS